MQQNAKIKLKKWQRMFVNRALNMANIKAIGFDMDHTLAIYNREQFEALAFRETLRKFIDAGYPEELSKLKFKPDFVIRGLLVDRARGNLLKVDGHKYVKIAYHGHEKLDKETRTKLYNRESFRAEDFLSVDTFFALSEVQLFTEMVDYMNRNPGRIQKTYWEVYADLRKFIDLCHRDGSIKNEVMADPSKFVVQDKHLMSTLTRLLDSGKCLFLVTNSHWDYTLSIMNYVFDDVGEDFNSWRDLFDYVIVGSGKPGFFTGTQPFYEVVAENNLLKLHHGPLVPKSVYHAGNAELFQKTTGFRGDQILYVGDHIYGDIMRSKGKLNWRTMLVVEELDSELPKLELLRDNLNDINAKLVEREELDEKIQIMRSKVSANNRQTMLSEERGDSKRTKNLSRQNDRLGDQLQDLEGELKQLDHDIRQLIQTRESSIHPIWGELMKVGLERSRIADQVAGYACVYTSRVSNLRFYSPFKRFTSSYDLLPHDL